MLAGGAGIVDGNGALRFWKEIRLVKMLGESGEQEGEGG